MTRVRSDDTYDIEFDDGDSEKRVELKRIKVKGGDRSRSRSRSRSPRGRKLREGDKCEARFRGKSSSKMYPGKVTRIHGDGSIDVKYEDGDSDRNLKPSHVKALDSGSDRSRSRSRSPSRGRMRVGTRVEARYRY